MESVLQDCEMQAQSGLEGVIHHFGRFFGHARPLPPSVIVLLKHVV